MGVEDGEERGTKAEPVKVTAHAAPVPWFRRPRNLVALLAVVGAATGGVYVVAHRDPGESKSGPSASARHSGGPNTTITDYLADNGISITPVRVGNPGTPVIGLPMPPGWSDAGPDTPPWAYGEILFDGAANPDDTPFIDVLLSKLEGDADPARVLEYAPGELKNLPNYRPVSEPNNTQLSGFEAVQLGGLYTKDGQERLIAQKTVVIPSPNGLFVLQLNANAPTAEAPAVQQATAVIDQQAKITP